MINLIVLIFDEHLHDDGAQSPREGEEPQFCKAFSEEHPLLLRGDSRRKCMPWAGENCLTTDAVRTDGLSRRLGCTGNQHRLLCTVVLSQGKEGTLWLTSSC